MVQHYHTACIASFLLDIRRSYLRWFFVHYQAISKSEGCTDECNDTLGDSKNANCTSDSVLTITDEAQLVCNGTGDHNSVGTGCREGFTTDNCLQLKQPTTSMDKISAMGSSICSPDDLQSPLSSRSSFLLPTPTTDEMCDEWSVISDNRSDMGDSGKHSMVLKSFICV